MIRSTAIFCTMFVISLVALGEDAKKPTGPVYAEPVRTVDTEQLGGDPTVKNADQPDPKGEAVRANTQAHLDEAGFDYADSLPTLGHRAGVPGKLQSADEIQKRLLSMYVVYLYVAAPEEAIPKDQLGAFIGAYDLVDSLTPEEAQIISTPREQARQQHLDNIGWTLENMSALAWLLGYDAKPSVSDGMISGERLDGLLDYLGQSWDGPEAFKQQVDPRSEAEVIQLEDVFYCAHNAVRSAQMGHAEQVPKKFHPVRDGGVIHEKRHSLTWALSPGVAWDETDLST